MMKKRQMNRREVVGAAVATTVVMTTSGAGSQRLVSGQNRFAQDFLPAWQISKEVTLEFARIMPEEYYNFRPTPDVRSFAEQMSHIAESNLTWTARFVKGEKPPNNNFKGTLTKVQIVQLLERSFDYVAGVARGLDDKKAEVVVDFFDGKCSKSRILWYVRDHVTHHRGQTVIYFRLKGMVPPLYRA
jgi:uncharacterized damage-inducible protein DinB